MSFASDVKNELCRVPLNRHCCAVAEAYGVLLYCHTFTTREIRIVTALPTVKRATAATLRATSRRSRSNTAVCR